MTIQSSTSRVTYSGDNVSTVFAIPFLFFANTDVTAVKTAAGGAVTTLTLNVDYTLTGAGVASGGTLTKTTALLTGETLGIFLDPPRTQLSHYLTNDIFPAATLEANLDREVQISQRLYDLVSRAVRAPDSDNNPQLTLPSAASRALKYPTFDVNGNLSMAVTLPSGTLSQASIGAFLYPQTTAEASAAVTPVNLYIPSHLNIGYVLPERYGGAGDNSTLNDTAHANAMKVAAQMGDGTVIYGEGSAGIWKFNAPVTIGAASQGRRVIGVGRVEWNFNAAIANTLDLVTIAANLNSLYQDQPQFDNIQVTCNSGGRDGVVLTVGNRPLIRNVRINNPGRDGYVESSTGSNWIEKAEVSVLVRFAGRNGFRQEILGTAGQAPFINEGNYYLEVRGVSAITAGGCALKLTGSAGLGVGAKISDNIYRTVFDAIYNTAATIPATSPVISDTIVVQNPTFNGPAWENTGTGGNPGAGPLIKVNSGTWGGINIYGANWNSFWGDGTLDAAITGVNRIDFSFPAKNSLVGTLAVKGSIDNQTVMALSGQTTAANQSDVTVTRTGAASGSVGQNANIQFGNSTSNTFAMLQEFNGALQLWTFSGGSWGERARILAGGAVQIAGLSAVYSVTGGAPSVGTGVNGDFAFRQDGGAGTSIYMKRAGAWVGIV